MRFLAAVDALPSLESMKFPVFSLLTGNFGLFRDEFAADSPLQQRVVRTPVQKWDLPTLRPTAVTMPAKGRCGWLSGTRGYPRSITSSREAMPRRGPSNEDGRRHPMRSARGRSLLQIQSLAKPAAGPVPSRPSFVTTSGKTDRQGSIFLYWLRPRSSSP